MFINTPPRGFNPLHLTSPGKDFSDLCVIPTERSQSHLAARNHDAHQMQPDFFRHHLDESRESSVFHVLRLNHCAGRDQSLQSRERTGINQLGQDQESDPMSHTEVADRPAAQGCAHRLRGFHRASPFRGSTALLFHQTKHPFIRRTRFNGEDVILVLLS